MDKKLDMFLEQCEVCAKDLKALQTRICRLLEHIETHNDIAKNGENIKEAIKHLRKDISLLGKIAMFLMQEGDYDV